MVVSMYVSRHYSVPIMYFIFPSQYMVLVIKAIGFYRKKNGIGKRIKSSVNNLYIYIVAFSPSLKNVYFSYGAMVLVGPSAAIQTTTPILNMCFYYIIAC